MRNIFTSVITAFSFLAFLFVSSTQAFAIVPSDVAGLQLWLKADAGVSNGSTAAVNGDTVQTWADQSGNGNNATQATAPKRPTYRTNILNGLPVLRFDGTTDALLTASFAPETSKRMSIFIVSTPNPGISGALLSTYPTGDLGVQSVTSGFGGPQYKFYLNGWAIASEYDPSAPNIQTLVRSGNTAVDLYRNGLFKETLTGFSNDAIPSNPLGIGAGTDGVSGVFAGDIAEIIIYNTALSNTDRSGIETYLKDKYAITPVLTAGTVTLDALSNSNVQASVTAAAGTMGPYTNQWHAGFNAGFTPDGSTALSGQTGLSLTYTPPDGRLRFLKVVQTDAQTIPASVTTSQVIPFAVPVPTLPTLETSDFDEDLVVLAIGDSITAGGVPAALETVLESHIDGDVTIVNEGLSGSTSTDWIPGSSLLNDAIAEANSSQATDVVIMLGTNDSKSTVATAAATYESNIEAIAQELLSNVPTLERVWLNESPYPVPGSYGLWNASSVALIGEYRLALDAIANGTDIFRGSDTTLAYSATHTNEYGDGIHPNGTGDVSFATQWAAPMLEQFSVLASYTAPIISSIASSPTETGVTITWTTDQPATSQVLYGSTASYGSTTTLDASLVTSHSVSITGLQAGTTYHFQVQSANTVNMLTSSSDQTFTTTAPASSGQGGGGGGAQGGMSVRPIVPVITTPVSIPSTVFFRNLTLNDRGSDVVALQRFLISKGHLLSRYDTGFFGVLTKQALAQYQAAQRISPAAGYFGPVTRSVVEASLKGVPTTVAPTAVVPSPFLRDLTIGSVGDDVKALQVFLNTHGYPVALSGNGSAGNETAVFSSLTKAALVRFQMAYGITPAEGYFGPKTRSKIIELRNF